MTDPASARAASPIRARFLTRNRLMTLGIVASSIPTAAVVIAFPVGNLYVESEWKKFRAEWEERGEIFDIASLYDTPVADADNFAKAPIIAEVYRLCADSHAGHDHHGEHDHGHESTPEKPARLQSLTYFSERKIVTPHPAPAPGFVTGRPVNLAAFLPKDSSGDPATNLLAAFAPHDALHAELIEAAQRPGAYFPVSAAGPFQTPLPHVPLLITALHGLRIETLALIESGPEASEKAAQRAIGTLRLLRHGTECQGLSSCVIRTLAIENAGLEPAWQALYRRRFADADWAAIARELATFEIGPRLMHSLRYERAALVWKVEGDFASGRSRPFSIPPVWSDLASLREYSELTQRHWFTDPAGRTLLRDWPDLNQLAVIEATAEATPRQDANVILLSGVHPVRDFARHAQWIETQRDHALVAIALERHRLATGSYPDRLSGLVPRWLPELPNCRSTGHPPRYELQAEGAGYRLVAMAEGDGSEGGDAIWIMPPAGQVPATAH